MSKAEIVIPELIMPDEFSWVTGSGTYTVPAPFDRAAEGSLYPDIEALQVGRPSEEVASCTRHEVAITILAREAISVTRADNGLFSVVCADNRYEEMVGPVSELRITTSPGIAWSRPVPTYAPAAYARLVQNLCYPALKDEGIL